MLQCAEFVEFVDEEVRERDGGERHAREPDGAPDLFMVVVDFGGGGRGGGGVGAGVDAAHAVAHEVGGVRDHEAHDGADDHVGDVVVAVPYAVDADHEGDEVGEDDGDLLYDAGGEGDAEYVFFVRRVAGVAQVETERGGEGHCDTGVSRGKTLHARGPLAVFWVHEHVESLFSDTSWSNAVHVVFDVGGHAECEPVRQQVELHGDVGFVEEHAEDGEKHAWQNVHFVGEEAAVVGRERDILVAVLAHVQAHPVRQHAVHFQDVLHFIDFGFIGRV